MKHLYSLSLPIVLIFSLFTLPNPAYSQDTTATNILRKVIRKYERFDSLRFHYSINDYQIAKTGNQEKKTMDGYCTIAQFKDIVMGEGKKMSNLNNQACKKFVSVFRSMDHALENSSARLLKACTKTPYYVISIQNQHAEGGEQRIYVDTLTFLINSVQESQMLADGGAHLNSFQMDSFYYRFSDEKPNLIALNMNKNMLKPGTKAPDFSLPDINGDIVKLSDFKGKLLLLDFWYVACNPCVKASYDLDLLQKEFGARGLVVMGMNTMDGPAKIRRHMGRTKMAYSSLLCSREVRNAYKVVSYPSFYLINEKGEIVFRTSGYSRELKSELQSAILQALSNR